MGGEGSLAFFLCLTSKPGLLAGAGATARPKRKTSPTASLRTGRAAAPSHANTCGSTRLWASGCRQRTCWGPESPCSYALIQRMLVGDSLGTGKGRSPPQRADPERHREESTDPTTDKYTLGDRETETNWEAAGDRAMETKRHGRNTVAGTHIDAFGKFLKASTTC